MTWSSSPVLFFLLFYRPAYYKPNPVADNNQLSPYLTHQLLPQLYNGVQRQEPFDLVVTQEGINDIAARLPMPKDSRGVGFACPTVIFVPDSIVFVTSAVVDGAKLIVTIELAPVLDNEGLLSVKMAKVKIGAMSITPVARILGRKMYTDRFGSDNIDPNDIKALLAASFFKNKPFDPVLTIDGKKVRIDKINIAAGSITLHFLPVPNNNGSKIANQK